LTAATHLKNIGTGATKGWKKHMVLKRKGYRDMLSLIRLI